jgi:hypothetical protein
MNVARKAIDELANNPFAASFFGSNGPTAEDIKKISYDNPAYVALGSIGPDIFCLLPDFKSFGSEIYQVFKFIEKLYEDIDPLIEDYDKSLGKEIEEQNQEINALSGGMLDEITKTGSAIMENIITDLKVFFLQQHDWGEMAKWGRF